MGPRGERRRPEGRATQEQPSRSWVSWLYVVVPALVVVFGGLGVWTLQGRGEGSSGQSSSPTIPAGAGSIPLPKYVTTAAMKEAYMFAVERPDVLAYMPCYCNCGTHSGHKSNMDCFVQGRQPDGSIVYDQHGSG